MSKIKEGDYVRIRDVDYDERIAKIEKVLDKDPCYKNMQMYKVDVFNHQPGCFSSFEIYKEDIIKHSPNIIDLIEVGDYVNGLLVHGISDFGVNVYMYGDAPVSLSNNEIKSVVTHQQFKEIEYEI